jgi:hypothetical protein
VPVLFQYLRLVIELMSLLDQNYSPRRQSQPFKPSSETRNKPNKFSAPQKGSARSGPLAMMLIRPQYHLSGRRNIPSRAQSRARQPSKTLWPCLAPMSPKRSSERQSFTLTALLWSSHLLSRYCATPYQISRYPHALALPRRS